MRFPPGREPGTRVGPDETGLARMMTIFKLKAEGKKVSEIAEQMDLTRQAVEYHLRVNKDFVRKYHHVFETLEKYSSDQSLPPDLLEAINDAYKILPRFAA